MAGALRMTEVAAMDDTILRAPVRTSRLASASCRALINFRWNTNAQSSSSTAAGGGPLTRAASHFGGTIRQSALEPVSKEKGVLTSGSDMMDSTDLASSSLPSRPPPAVPCDGL